ncbi:hypothetical protein LINPERHAP2_LOCUS11562 [Linum perenne]
MRVKLRIVFEPSNRFAPIDFRLVVSKGNLSHFVFLDVEELVWLKSTLEVAVSNRWKVPSSCSFTGKRRVLRLGCFEKNGNRFLNVAEWCRNGRQFFVNIPREENSDGWPSLLKLLDDLTAELVPPPPKSPPVGVVKKSFAEVVGGLGLGDSGRCSISDDAGIVVDTLGVADRRKFLDRCLCFRFVSSKPEVVNWKIFRVWMHKNWGISSSANIWCLADDIWLLDCGSEQAVTRVIKLERCWFGATRVLLDRWTVEAGRSKYLASQNLAWVTVQGIPLHLRSLDLFQRLGEACGGFLDYDDKLCPLNSVRLKVALSSSMPTQIRVCFLEESFILKVVRESWEEDNRDKGLGELVVARKSGEDIIAPPIEDWKARLLKKKAKAFEVGESSRSGAIDNGGFETNQGTGWEANSGDRSSTLDGNQVFEDLSLDTSFEEEDLPVGFFHCKKLDQVEKRSCGTYVGLKFNDDVGICVILKRGEAAKGETLVQLMSFCWTQDLGLEISFLNKMTDLGRIRGLFLQNVKTSMWVVGAIKARISNSEDLSWVGRSYGNGDNNSERGLGTQEEIERQNLDGERTKQIRALY